MNIKALCTSLFAIITLVAGQVSLGMEMNEYYFKKLPPYHQNAIAKNRVKDVTNYIDRNKKPLSSFNCGRLVACSPDGKRIISTENETVDIWDIETENRLLTFNEHTDTVYTAAFNSNGTKAVSGGWNNIVKIWDTQTGDCSLTPEGHSNTISSVAFNPNSTKVASGSYDQMVKIWDATTGKCSLTLEGHTNFVNSVAFSPDGTHVASGSGDKTVRIWDTQTGKCSFTLEGHTGAILSVTFSPDGRYLATGSDDKTVKIWDLKTEQVKYDFKGHTGGISSVAFSPDGNYLATGSFDKTVKIWDLKTGLCLHDYYGSSSYVVAVFFRPDGTVVSGSWNSTVKIWNIDDTPKQAFLNELTIQQANLLTKKVWPVIQKDEIFEPEADSEDHRILMSFSPKAQQYLQDHVKIIAHNNEQIHTNLDRKNTETNEQNPDNDEQPENNNDNKQNDEKEVNPDNTDKQNTKKPDALADATGLSGFFKTPFINKKWLWTGISIGSFVATAATIFCYYKYFKHIAKFLGDTL